MVMKGIKIAALVLFVFFLGIYRVVGFEVEKISLNQLQYNSIQTFLFFFILILLVQFDKFIYQKKRNKIAVILLKIVSVIFIFYFLNFVNHQLLLCFYSRVLFWPNHVNIMFPVIWLVYGIYKVFEKEEIE